jgi:hypothetical protein
MTVVGIDLAKNIFRPDGVARTGRVVLTRRVRRDHLLEVSPSWTEPDQHRACTSAF